MIKEKLLQKLYCDQKLSMVEVADKISTTARTIEYWLRKYNIPRRSRSESAYVKQNPNGDPFKIKRNLTQKEKGLLITGLILYLGEGGKKFKHSIQLGNLDPRVIQIFVKFLRKICRINENKLRLFVRLHRRFNKNKAQIYWSELLNLPSQQVLVYRYNDPRSKDEKQWSKYGIAMIQFNNIKLKKWLDEKINRYLDRLE